MKFIFDVFETIETIKIRGNNPMFWLKLYIFINILIIS